MLMKKTLLAALTASLLSVNSYCIDGDAGALIDEAQNQNVSEEDLKTISELKAERQYETTSTNECKSWIYRVNCRR